MKKFFLLIIFILAALSGYSINPFAKWTKTELILCNGVVRRTIKLPAAGGTFLTTSYKPLNGTYNSLSDTCTDFQFEVDDVIYSGRGYWDIVKIQVITDDNEGSGAEVRLLSRDKKIELSLKFLMYPNSPAIRKSLVVKNLTDKPVKLESVDIEKFEVPPYYPVTYSWIYHDYGRRRFIGPYDGGRQDGLIIVHDMNREQGIVLGNEASGVMKHTSVFYDAQDICTGLTHKNSPFPFRKWIEAGESFETPQVFTMVYNNRKTTDEILNITVPDFVRKYMGIRLSELTEKPTFVYNTWEPFNKNIDEKLVMELAKAAADAGMKEFIIDDGWQESYGDWGIDMQKFPNGLKPVFEGWETHIKSIAGALPIMLGDPRKLSDTDLKKYRSFADWLQLMERRYSIMSYRQDLSGFGEPMEGMWDGFQRINTEEKNGGIIGIFRHGAVEPKRIVTINYLDPLKIYDVRTMDGTVVASMTGSDLREKGFEVTLSELYSGELFEVVMK